MFNSATSIIWTDPFSVDGVSDWLLLLSCLREILAVNANRVDPDQTPRSAASDRGLNCLLMSLSVRRQAQMR